MEISSNTSNYQTLQAQQRPITTPVEPNHPTYSNKEIYEGSQGNLVRRDGEVSLTPQGQNNIDSNKAEKEAQADAQTQATKDAHRGVAVDYLAASSKQSQVEIYLAVATNGKYDSGDNTTADVISELRDVQKQNNAVQAFAAYQENQAQGKPALF